MYRINEKRLYADALIREGNKLFNKGDYELAAEQYEEGARFSSTELLDKTFIFEAYRLAVNAWISASMPEKASKIIENLPQELRIALLKEILSNVIKKVDYLVHNVDYKLAIEHLNTFIRLYHQNNLLADLKKLNDKQLNIVDLMLNASKIRKTHFNK